MHQAIHEWTPGEPATMASHPRHQTVRWRDEMYPEALLFFREKAKECPEHLKTLSTRALDPLKSAGNGTASLLSPCPLLP